jgi:hypothetical protein
MMDDAELIRRIQEALNTTETGESLVEIARNAYRNGEELASMYNWEDK